MTWLALLLALVPALASGQTRSAPLEAESSSARVAALGGAGLGLDDGADWAQGPAGLQALSGWSLRAHQQTLAAGLQRQWLEALSPAGRGLGVAAGLGYTSFGSLDSRDDSGAIVGRYDARRISVAVGLGSKLGEKLSAGAALQAFREDLGDTAFSSVLGHASLDYRFNPYFQMSLAAGIEDIVAGVQTRLPELPDFTLSVQSGLDAGTPSLRVGGTYDLGPAALRLGWRQGMGDSDATLSGLSAGFGARWKSVGLDYAWLPLGALGESHRFSLSYSPVVSPALPAPRVVPTPAPTAPPVPPLESAPPPLPELSAPLAASATAGPALELEFRLPDSTSDQAIVADENGGEAKALALYQEAIKQDPADTRAWMGLGHLYYRRHDLDSALQCFEQVLRLNPTETALRDWVDKVKKARKRE